MKIPCPHCAEEVDVSDPFEFIASAVRCESCAAMFRVVIDETIDGYIVHGEKIE